MVESPAFWLDDPMSFIDTELALTRASCEAMTGDASRFDV